jgi:hypothetical protein
MKAIFSLVALLVVLGATSVLVKKQLGGSSVPTASGGPANAGSAPATPTQQVQQVGKQVEGLMQQPRPEAPDQ